MYEFVCNHIIPGCTTTLDADTEEEVRDKAIEHMKKHHGMDSDDDERLLQVKTAIHRVVG